MRRIIIYTLLALTMLGGVAMADRDRHRHRGNWHDGRAGGVYVQRSYPGSGYRHNNYRHNNYRSDYRYRNRGYVVRPQVRVVRRPIYVQRPVIQYRYYNYAQRPRIIVENYQPMVGYIWIQGSWQWNGYEWIWQPGYHQPDPAYDQYQDPYPYAPQYDGGYQQPYYPYN